MRQPSKKTAGRQVRNLVLNLKRKKPSSSTGDDEQPPLSKHPKFSLSSSSSPLSTNRIDSSNDDDGNANLFQEMNQVNSTLISLSKQFSIRADYKYFIDHQEMFDEFMENVHHFYSEVDRQRKRVAFERLSEDSLFHILQYVTMSDLVRNCRWVSKMWRQQVLKQEFTVELGRSRDSQNQSTLEPSITESLLKSELVGSIVSLKLKNVSDKSLALLCCHSKSLNKLQHLDLKGNALGAKYLKRFSLCKNLASLNLSKVQKLDYDEALEILSSKLLANCKMLNFSNKFDNMLKDLAVISQLSKLTHLELNQNGCGDDDGLEEFLQSKVNLQYLSLQNHNLKVVPNLFTINSTSNMNSNTVIFNQLTKLNISYCNLTNQMLFDIILSPKLPNLTTLIATHINQTDQINSPVPSTAINTNTNNSTLSSIGGVGYRNSSNLTELNMNDSFVHPVAEMIKFTPKLKKLSIWDLGDWSKNDRYTYDSKLVEDYSFLVHTDSKLSRLEYLEISKTNKLSRSTSTNTGWMELVFTNLMFSNLKYLNCRTHRYKIRDDELSREVKMIEECVNLPKLELVNDEIVKGGDLTDEQRVKNLQAFRNNPMFNSNQLKIENFRYESVYPNDEKNNGRIYIS